jgi:AcrR family transcriptional regulator
MVGEGRPVDDIAASLGVSRATLYRYLGSSTFSRQ